jgi:BlaI family transcriptional regulator, penicillinase repressor
MIRISEAESRIMDALWRRGPLVVEDIVAEVAGPQQWSDRTVKSLIGRMLNKKAIESTRRDGRTYYRPLVQRDDYMMAESQSFLDRIFGGKVAPFVSQFAERQKLSPEDVAQLKALIDRLDDDE